MDSECPVCKSKVPKEDESLGLDGRKLTSYSCPRCGNYHIEGLDPTILRHRILNDDLQKIATLSHWIRTRHESIRKEPRDNQGRRKSNLLDKEMVESVIKNPRPFLQKQKDNFVRWIGDNVTVGGQYTDVDKYAIQAIVGSATFEEFELVFRHLRDEKLIEHKSAVGKGEGVFAEVTLSFTGWERYRELERSTSDRPKAFMAMEYGQTDLESLFKNVLKPAVEQAGFDLFVLRERPKAGLMDDRLRAEIRASRFLIADLTHDNGGAYWEAGYAEALGKPVIYTCEKKKFEACKTHFDTNHHLTLQWDLDEPQKVAEELKATIRATLPAEAKSTDD